MDMEIRRHPSFRPQEPAKVYEEPGCYQWADRQVEQRFNRLIEERHPLVVVDGSGTKVPRRLDRMKRARERGYTVVVVYVRVSLGAALARNSMRTRKVPYDVMMDYMRKVEPCVCEQAEFAEEVVILDNDPKVCMCGLPLFPDEVSMSKEESLGDEAQSLGDGGEMAMAAGGTNDFY